MPELIPRAPDNPDFARVIELRQLREARRPSTSTSRQPRPRRARSRGCSGRARSGGCVSPGVQAVLPGQALSGNGISGLGQIVGQLGGPTKNVFVYSNGIATDLGHLGVSSKLGPYPTGINDSGQIVGDYYPPVGAMHAFIYTGGVLQDLGTFGGYSSTANSINNNGVTVGNSDRSVGPAHAFLYDGIMHDLGALGDGLEQRRRRQDRRTRSSAIRSSRASITPFCIPAARCST